MKQKSFLGIYIFLWCSLVANAQLDSIQRLPEVILTDSRLVQFSKGFKVEKLTDSVIERNQGSLTETLQYNTAIYFKENGRGMVSSPSFRGTNAAQTAVIWNGITINSVFTGQTDFNTISPINYDEISVRSGGGGVQFGSGAVGGSVHLNHSFSFDTIHKTALGLRYGSFSTLGANASTTQTWKNHYLNVGVDFISSENDYEYIGKNKKNIHGQFLRFVANVNEARKLKRGYASWNSEYSYNDRNFSGSLNTIGKDAYKDIATRNLWHLHQEFGVFSTNASVAHLFEQYDYFPDSEKPYSTGGKANTVVGALQASVFLNKKVRVNGKVEYNYTNAEGDNIGEKSRKTLAAVFLVNHKVSKKFDYGINLRQDFSDDFDSPFLFSVDSKYRFSNRYSIRFNGSKNYRVPTFNDMYWIGGGNLELVPETSYQVEIGQEIKFGNLKADVAAFYISSEDLIKWIPGTGALWHPMNINKTRNYGIETVVDYEMNLNTTHKLNFKASYSFTKAEDLEKEKQLIYVPFHQGFGSITYAAGQFSAYAQGMFNGAVYTTTDNSESVDGHTIFNLGAQYSFPFNPQITLGGSLNNVFNVYYENVAFRPMPSRSIELFLNFNI